jgi:hypothetical protein
MNRRAVDLHLFIDGHDQSFVEAYKPLADDEVRLDPEHHIWGGHGTTDGTPCTWRMKNRRGP